MIEKLTKLWKTCETKELALIFESYMKEIGVRKTDRRRKDNINTYLIHGDSTNWNRVQCYYQKDSEESRKENVLLTLRKRAGDYFIIEREGVRAFEVDYRGLVHYNEVLLNEIIKEHQLLFDNLFLKLGID